MGKVHSTFGELLFAFVMASIASVFAAIAGFLSSFFISNLISNAESAAWAPILFGPPIALIFGLAVFILVFRWVKNYGDPKTDGASNEPN